MFLTYLPLLLTIDGFGKSLSSGKYPLLFNSCAMSLSNEYPRLIHLPLCICKLNKLNHNQTINFYHSEAIEHRYPE